MWATLRKLLIKLVAVETVLVGWLAYWLFLVYANNPSVSDQLSTSLQRFPQLSFSTVDIAVLVIIATLAVTLAYKFQRGLRPGIRLERALQMLENLMKRNLVLEAQVAELKIEKSHAPTITSSPPIIASASTEPRAGSWEKAFRTPLEAGPPTSAKAGSNTGGDIPFGKETGIPPPRIESKSSNSSSFTKPPIVIGEKGSERTPPPTVIIPEKPVEKTPFPSPPTTASTNWEASPQFIGESQGILTPSRPPRKVPTVSESGGLRQPYIPSPAPKVAAPSFIVGPMSSPTPPKISIGNQKTLQRPRTAQSKTSIIASPTPSPLEPSKPVPLPEISPPTSLTPPPVLPPSTIEPSIKDEELMSKPYDEVGKTEGKKDDKPDSRTPRKKSLDDENDSRSSLTA